MFDCASHPFNSLPIREICPLNTTAVLQKSIVSPCPNKTRAEKRSLQNAKHTQSAYTTPKERKNGKIDRGEVDRQKRYREKGRRERKREYVYTTLYSTK